MVERQSAATPAKRIRSINGKKRNKPMKSGLEEGIGNVRAEYWP
jgi:hypothetical protein